MMQSEQDRHRDNRPGPSHGSPERCVLVQCQMRARLIVVLGIQQRAFDAMSFSPRDRWVELDVVPLELVRSSGPSRPERHYMRGPGPRWLEKNGQVAIRP